MEDLMVTVHSLRIPIDDNILLLPNAAVAEIIGYKQPEPLSNNPDWLLGTLFWRGQNVPLVAFEALLGNDLPPIQSRARVAIFNSLTGNAEIPFFGIVLQDIPHLTKAYPGVVNSAAEEFESRAGVLSHVMIHGEPAIIPDLEAIEKLLVDYYQSQKS